VRTQPEAQRFLVPESALMEDEDPPSVVVVQDVTVEKKDDKEEKVGKAKKCHAVLGLRDRSRRMVEIVALEDPEEDPKKKIKLAVDKALFIIEGGFGLHDDDAVKVEEAAAAEHK
jgi:hypothetical protein